MTTLKENTDWNRTLNDLAAESDKHAGIALLLAVLFGRAGLDRFYLGYGLIGFCKIFTFGGFCIWWLMDIVLLATGKMKDAEGRRLTMSP